jgi:serine O-acetyltransferase
MKVSVLQKDFYRYSGKIARFPFLSGFFHPTFRFIVYFRWAQQYYNKRIIGIVFRVLLRREQLRLGIQISYKTNIKEGFYIGHWGTIVINPLVCIGKNCNISHGVTIGQTNRGARKGVPKIGDYVWIGANAVLVGNITVGDRVLIAPNTYLNTDVPSDSLVMGNPAQIVPKKNATEGYINNIYEEN